MSPDAIVVPMLSPLLLPLLALMQRISPIYFVPQPLAQPPERDRGGGDNRVVSNPRRARSASYRSSKSCTTLSAVGALQLFCFQLIYLIYVSTQVTLRTNLPSSSIPEGKGNPTPFESYTSITGHRSGSCHDKTRFC